MLKITTFTRNKNLEKKLEIEEDADLEIEYCPNSNITEHEFQPNEKFVVVKETPQEILEIQQKEVKKHVKPNSMSVNETQTQLIPETQKHDDIPVIPEKQINVIVIDD